MALFLPLFFFNFHSVYRKRKSNFQKLAHYETGGKGDFVDVIKLRTLKWRDYPRLPG